MRAILDTSVAAKWVLKETDSDKAQILRDEFEKGLHEFLSPDIFPAELGHLLTRAERQKRIHVGDAEVLWNSVMLSRPQLIPYIPYAERAVQISSQVRMGVYDCINLALAEAEKCDFLTADAKIATLKGKFSILLLSDLP